MKIVGDNIHRVKKDRDGKPLFRGGDVQTGPPIYGPFMNIEQSNRVLGLVLRHDRSVHNNKPPPTTARGMRRQEEQA